MYSRCYPCLTLTGVGTPSHCKHCKAEFASRSALFRHLRTDGLCNQKAGLSVTAQKLTKLALLVSHWGRRESASSTDSKDDEHSRSCSSSLSQAILHLAGICPEDSATVQEIRNSISSTIELDAGLLSCCTIVALKAPSGLLEQPNSVVAKLNKWFEDKNDPMEVLKVTEVPTNFDAVSRCSCQRFQLQIPMKLLFPDHSKPDIIENFSAKAVSKWKKIVKSCTDQSEISPSRFGGRLRHDHAQVRFCWTTFKSFEALNDTILRWTQRVSEFISAPFLHLCIKVNGFWVVCKKNMFASDSIGSSDTGHHTVHFLRFCNTRFKWAHLDFETFQIGGDLEKEQFPVPGSVNAVGFLEVFQGGEDTDFLLGGCSILRQTQCDDAVDVINNTVKKLVKQLRGTHYFHNLSENSTAFTRNAQRPMYTAICHGTIENHVDEWMILSFAAHRFSHDEIQRLSTLIFGIVAGIFPKTFLQNFLQPDFVVSIPPAPSHLLCLVEAHYDGFENATGTQLRPRNGCSGYTSGFRNAEDVVGVAVARSKMRAKGMYLECQENVARTWVQRTLIPTIPEIERQLKQYLLGLSLGTQTPVRATVFGTTLDNHKQNEIEQKLSLLYGAAEVPRHDQSNSKLHENGFHQAYDKVLSMLRDLDRSKLWPSTGEQRKRRISGEKGDSFTLGMMPGPNEPTANKKYPDLLEACFDLESAIMPSRHPSSTVVINRNAQFMPHTDSGAGHGQSTSLIVALGKFTGGELAIEGKAYDIKYSPMEFDGWKQRHWTLPFEGERFSIVWFTPYGCKPRPVPRFRQLRNGNNMPVLGLGTYRLKGERVKPPLHAALNLGYKHIDTAQVYKNHKQIGEVLRSADSTEVFITSKLAPSDQGYENAKMAILRAISELSLMKPLDLFLIHWPGTQGCELRDLDNAARRCESWRALEDAYFAGKVKSIGVSNFQLNHLQELLSHCRVIPHVNQIEMHPKLPQLEMVKFCYKQSIQVVAYASLGVGELIEDPIALCIAQKHSRSVSQVLLRWAIEKGACVIPKSAQLEHIKENQQIFDFELSPEDTNSLDQMSSLSHEKRFCWDPSQVL